MIVLKLNTAEGRVQVYLKLTILFEFFILNSKDEFIKINRKVGFGKSIKILLSCLFNDIKRVPKHEYFTS